MPTTATTTATVGSTPSVADTPTPGTTPAEPPAPDTDDNLPATVYEVLLGTIPDTPEARSSVYINDYTLVRQMFDIPLPGPGDDEDALEVYYDYRPPLSGWGEIYPVSMEDALFGPFNQYRVSGYENFQYLAFDVRNMDESIVGGPLDSRMEVIRGRFDPQATDEALKTCSECPAPSREEHRGIPYYSWGEDYARNEQLKFAPPAFDRRGRGGRIAALDEYLFRTLGDSEMKALIDTNLNKGPSLADVAAFRVLANRMSRLGAYTMFLSDDVEIWGLPGYVESLKVNEYYTQAEMEEKERILAASGPWLRPYEAYATGAGKDEDGSYMALVLVHADDTSAEENVGLLRRIIEEERSVHYDTPWSDYIDADRSEIHSEGRVLLAKFKLRSAYVGLWIDWVHLLDSLILYE